MCILYLYVCMHLITVTGFKKLLSTVLYDIAKFDNERQIWWLLWLVSNGPSVSTGYQAPVLV